MRQREGQKAKQQDTCGLSAGVETNRLTDGKELVMVTIHFEGSIRDLGRFPPETDRDVLQENATDRTNDAGGSKQGLDRVSHTE